MSEQYVNPFDNTENQFTVLFLRGGFFSAPMISHLELIRFFPKHLPM